MNLKTEIEKCKTRNQLDKVLAKHKIKIRKDDSSEVGCLSVWLDKVTRVYQRRPKENLIFQTWTPVVMKASGISTFPSARRG